MVETPTGDLMYMCLAMEAHLTSNQSSSYGASSLRLFVLTRSTHSGTFILPDFLRWAARATVKSWALSKAEATAPVVEETAFVEEIPAVEDKPIQQDGTDTPTNEPLEEVVGSVEKLDKVQTVNEITASVEEDITAPVEDRIGAPVQEEMKDKVEDINKEESIDNLSTDSDLGSVESLEHSTKDEQGLDDSFSDTEIIIATTEDKMEKVQSEVKTEVNVS